MYTHFLGNFLYSNDYITKEELINALEEKSNASLKLGTLAINSGYMTASEVENVLAKQAMVDKRFGEIAIGMGYLSEDQLVSLLSNQQRSYLLLSQVLIDTKAITNDELEGALKLFKVKYSLPDRDEAVFDDIALHDMVEHFVEGSEARNEHHVQYIMTLIKNLTRFIGDDFSLINLDETISKSTVKISQKFFGDVEFTVNMYGDRDTLVFFVSRFLNETYIEYNDIVSAGAANFMILNNNLYSVAMNNKAGLKFDVKPYSIENGILENSDPSMVLRVLFPFGEIAFEIAE